MLSQEASTLRRRRAWYEKRNLEEGQTNSEAMNGEASAQYKDDVGG
jgi:hypothetical protein